MADLFLEEKAVTKFVSKLVNDFYSTVDKSTDLSMLIF